MELTPLSELRKRRNKLVKLLDCPLHPESPLEQELVAFSKESIGNGIARIDAEVEERTATESPE